MKKSIQTKSAIKLAHPSVQLALALALFCISVLASRSAAMTSWEEHLFIHIYNWPAALHPIFFVITQLGSVHMLATLLFVYLLFRHYHTVLRLLLTGTLAYTLSGVAKDLWGRIRPHEHLADIVVLDYVVRGPGFPSGHMALATALGLTLMHYTPRKYRWLLICSILLVGISRIYLGVHAPLDILGGFAIGWACHALFRHVRLYDIAFGKRAKKREKKPRSNKKQN